MGHDRSSYPATDTICVGFGEQIKAKNNRQDRTQAFRKVHHEPLKRTFERTPAKI
jgi:hypothetical protein